MVKRAIVKPETEQQWCDAILGSVCAVNKKAAARLVCTNQYRSQIAAKDDLTIAVKSDQSRNNDSREFAQLRQELIEIKLKRLNVADKVLELKRKELQSKERLKADLV